MSNNSQIASKQVILDLQVNSKEAIDAIVKARERIDELKNAKKVLEQEFKSGNKSLSEFRKEVAVIDAAIKDVNTTIRANEKELQNQIKANNSAEDSLNSMRVQLSSLKNQYADLSQAERESAQGKDLLNKIHDMTVEVKGLETAQLDFTRNVGNYMSALTGPVGVVVNGFKALSNGSLSLGLAFKNLGTMISGLSKQLLKLMANPWVAAFSAIVLVVMKLVDAFKKNDAAMTALQSAMAAFKPVIDLINKGVQVLVRGLTGVVEGFSKMAQKVMSAIPFLKKYAEAEEDIVRSTDNLEESQRQYALNEAKRNKEIAELTAKSVEKDKYSVAERKGFLKQALDLEKKNLEEKRDNAKEELRIAEKKAALEMGYSKMTQEVYDMMSDEMKNNINQLRIAVENVETEYAEGTRRIKSRLSNFNEEEKKERQARAKEAADAAKERRKLEQEALRDLEDLYNNSIKDILAKEIALAKAAGERQIENLKERLKTEKNLSKTAKRAINEQIILLEADLQLKLGDIRKKYESDQIKKQLDVTKSYYNVLLKSLSSGDKVDIANLLLDINAKEVKDNLYDSFVKPVKDAYRQIKDAYNQGLDEDKIKEQFGSMFEVYDIDTSKGYWKALEDLMVRYYSEVQSREILYNNFTTALDKDTEKEKLKNTLESQNKEQEIAQKHADIINQIQTEGALEAFYDNELEKSRILEEQAQRRLKIAKDEAAKVAGYTAEEAITLYGSIAEWQVAVAEANLKVVQSQNDVNEAVRNTAKVIEDQKKKMEDAAYKIVDAISQAAAGLQSLFETLAEDNAEFGKYAKAMAMVQIMISSAVSIAQAIQGATAAASAGGPLAPVLIAAYVAEMVGIVAGGIASAVKTLKSVDEPTKPKFATGGLVTGPGTGISDSIDAELSNGEYVINAKAVQRVGVENLDAINYRGASLQTLQTADGNIELMKAAFKEVVSEIQPVVSVKEITNKQNRVRVKES